MLTDQQPPACSEFLLISQADYEMLRNPFTADVDFSVVLWAWGACLVLWALGLGAGSIVNVVKQFRK